MRGYHDDDAFHAVVFVAGIIALLLALWVVVSVADAWAPDEISRAGHVDDTGGIVGHD